MISDLGLAAVINLDPEGSNTHVCIENVQATRRLVPTHQCGTGGQLLWIHVARAVGRMPVRRHILAASSTVYLSKINRLIQPGRV